MAPTEKEDILHLTHRINSIEDDVKDLKKSDAEKSLKLVVIQTDVAYIKTAVNQITSGVNRIFWAIGLSLLAGFMTFVLAGGFTLVGGS